MINTSKLYSKPENPYELQKVYFSCHPDDFEKYFNVLSNEIRSIQNCAIYYDIEPESDNDREEFLFNLSSMQCFIIPITKRFLTEDCKARNEEYGFAVYNNIPIIPIAMEPGLDKDFSEIMNKVGKGLGDIQFLLREQDDYTEIPYKEKLKKRVMSILIGDETAERIRAAFDASIFLSYRKKDRKQANALMKLIHRIPGCRDIAIWYDEYIIPGEFWREAIINAIAKSNLVAFAITPNVMEEGNYIREHEYNDAKKIKQVVPIEVEHTERDEAFNKAFPGLAKFFDGKNKDEVYRALKSIAVSQNNDNPDHLFLIGLAYLGGIDVERNPKMAEELITRSANNGCPEAMEKLVSMYKEGEGVEKNYITSIEWQKKLISFYEQTYTKTDSEEDAINLFYSMVTLGDYYDPFYNYEIENIREKRWDAYLKCLDFSKELANKTGSISAKKCLAESYEKLADPSIIGWDYPKIKGYYEKALEIWEALAKKTGTVKERIRLAYCYDKLGKYYTTFGFYHPETKECYEKACEILRTIYEEIGTIDSEMLWSTCYKELVFALRENDKAGIKEAKTELVTTYKKYLNIVEAIAKKIGYGQAIVNLSDSYFNLVRFAITEGNFTEAKKYKEKELMARKAIADKAKTEDAKIDFALCYCGLGNILKTEGNLCEAREYLRKGCELLKETCKETRNASNKELCSFYYEKYNGIIEKLYK